MKGWATLLWPLILVAVLAISVFAWGVDWAIDNPSTGDLSGGSYGNLLPDQNSRLKPFKPQFSEKTIDPNQTSRIRSSGPGSLRDGPHLNLKVEAEALHKKAKLRPSPGA